MDIDQALADLTAERTELEPSHEGLRDFARLNLVPTAVTQVRAHLEVMDRRAQLLGRAIDALTALREDGYPGLPLHEVNADVLDDLRANADSINAAFGRFTQAEQATTLDLQVGAVELK